MEEYLESYVASFEAAKDGLEVVPHSITTADEFVEWLRSSAETI